MLTAKKSRWFEEVFAIYNRNLFKRRFHSIQISGLDYLKNKDAKIPLLIYANHSSWWDGLLAFEISRLAKLDSFVLMDEVNLKRYFLFRYLGAFSVAANRRGAFESVQYAADLLNFNTERTLWIFPQGKIMPNDYRPIRFFNGAARIVEKVKKCLAVPLGIQIEFLGQFKPEIYVKIGEPNLIETNRDFDSKLLTEMFTKNIVKVLDELKDTVTFAQPDDYLKVL